MTGQDWEAAAAALEEGLTALHLDAGLAEPLLCHLRLLERWGRAWNLTAIENPHDMVVRHLLDSLAIAQWVRGPEVADIGSGAGFPGIPLALVLPELRFTLIDAVAKKVRFIRQVGLEMGLPNVEAVHARAESYRPPAGFATVTSRAFAALPEFVRVAGHLCAPGGRMLAMKGRRPDAEIAALPPDWKISGLHEIHVPGLDAERTLVEMTRR